MPSTTETDTLADFLTTTAFEISVRADSPGDPETVLLAADRVARSLAGLQARWLAIAEQTGVVGRSGARNPAAWLEALTGEAGRDAHHKAGVAEAVCKTPSLGEGLLDGSLNSAQAQQIAQTAETTKASAERIEEFIEDVKGLSAKETQRLARDLERELCDETPDERLAQQKRKRSKRWFWHVRTTRTIRSHHRRTHTTTAHPLAEESAWR